MTEARPARGLLIAAALSTLVTMIMAWPVLWQPATQIFGHEILGRFADPYTVIYQFGTTGTSGLYAQPLTDIFGWLLGRIVPAIAAYNVVTLLSFPLSAIAAYALGRYLTASHGAALVAALAFAFSPAHIAQAAYHPYIAQTQWLPLYVLALVAVIDRRSAWRFAWLLAACVGVVLSNVYGGLIAAVMTPVVLATFWGIRSDADRNPWPFLGPALMLAAASLLAAGLIWVWHPELFSDVARFSGSVDDVAFYRARGWAYLTPAVDHPWLAWISGPIFEERVTLELVELQLYLGYALLLLAIGGLVLSVPLWKTEPRWRSVSALLATGVVALFISIGPTSGVCDGTTIAPLCLLSKVAPMFRAYACFGLFVQLMLSVAAGAGATLLARRGRGGRLVTGTLLAIAAFEYWPLSARAHDVLPTSAHRALVSMNDREAVLDCYPNDPAGATIPWMMGRRVVFLDGRPLDTCADPQLGLKLADMQITRVIVRKSRIASQLPTPLPVGLTPLQSYPDAELYAVSRTPPPIVTLSAEGFYDFEHAGDDWWRWMSPNGRWVLRNTTPSTRTVSLSLTLQSFAAPRHLTVAMDGVVAGRLDVGMAARDATVGPWTLAPGAHVLTFTQDGEVARPSDLADTGDSRQLTVSFRNERWIVTP